MPTSLITVCSVGTPQGLNVLASDGSGQSAMDAAIAAGVPAGDSFLSGQEVGARAIDIIIASAVAPATDGSPQALFSVSFRNGSGANGTTPTPLLVLAWPQTSGDTTTPAETLASRAAAASANAVASQVAKLATVDVDATSGAAIASMDLTRFAFLCLFTQAELATILGSANPGVKTFLFMFQAAEDMLLTDPNTIGGVEYLVSLGLLTQARASQILANTPYISVTVPTINVAHGQPLQGANLAVTGGVGPYTYLLSGGPAGMTVSAAGQLIWTPPAPNTYNYSVTVTDSQGNFVVAAGTITAS